MNTISIEELRSSDFEVVASWLSNPEINRWLTSEWRDRNVSATNIAIAVRNPKNRLFLVRLNSAPCGLVALADVDPADRTAMVWYLLGETAFARQGVVSAAVKQLASKSFQEYKLESLYGWVIDGNVASLKVLQKAGFREAGRLRNAARLNGHPADRIYFDLVAPESYPTPAKDSPSQV